VIFWADINSNFLTDWQNPPVAKLNQEQFSLGDGRWQMGVGENVGGRNCQRQPESDANSANFREFSRIDSMVRQKARLALIGEIRVKAFVLIFGHPPAFDFGAQANCTNKPPGHRFRPQMPPAGVSSPRPARRCVHPSQRRRRDIFVEIEHA